MKTILKIIVILLVASIVAGAFSLAVSNSSTASGSDEGEKFSTTDANGQTIQPMERPEGGERDGGSAAGGLVGVLGTLAKLTGVTILIQVLQKGFDQINNMKKWKLAQR